ncbi:MAG: hypothetical protein OMM_13325, partial [Candidatus Magnetoglobus multicellularis str. Araruama]
YTNDQTIDELKTGDRVKDSQGNIYRYIGESRLMVSNYDYSSLTKPDELLQGKTVRLAEKIGDAASGGIYEYLGEDRTGLEDPVDLSSENYTDTNLWKKVNNPLNISLADMELSDSTKWLQTKANNLTISGDITFSSKDDASIAANTDMKAISSTTNDGGASLVGGLIDAVTTEYKYTSKSGSQTLAKDDYVRVASDHTSGGVTKALYRYNGTGETVDLSTEDYSDRDKWVRVLRTSASDAIPNIGNVTGSDSQAFGGIVVRNDLRSSVDAYIQYATVNATGNITITAEESATITANDSSTVTSSGGSAFGSGKSMAVNGIIATNLVLSGANAYISDSTVTTTEGKLSVDAKNSSIIDSKIVSNTKSGDKAIGVTLAFNTIGWEAQNILFQTIDALLGTEIGNENPAETVAYIEDTALTIAGDVSVTADNSALLNATISNAA